MIHSTALLLLLQATSTHPLGVAFNPPPGWVPVEAPPLRAFAPPNLAPGQMLLLAVWPADRVGGPQVFGSWFETKLSNPGETVLQQSPLDRRTANGLDVLTVTQRVNLPQLGQVVRVVYGINAGERVAVAMLTSNQDQLVNQYALPARQFFESLRFSEAAQPAPTQASPGRAGSPIPAAGFAGSEPRGLFYRLQSGGGGMETRTRIFLPSQRVIRVEPYGDGNTIDLGRCSPDTCGGYRVEGGSLVVRWDNGNTERLSFVRSGFGFTLDGQDFHPARGVELAEAVGDWRNASGGTDAVLRLRGDRSFEWSGGSSATTLRGRFELQGLMLTLHFSDGTSKSYALFAAARSRPAGLISLDGTVYSRRS
jgi:hypothetical protein